jgi:hypothetical protein
MLIELMSSTGFNHSSFFFSPTKHSKRLDEHVFCCCVFHALEDE